MKKEMVTMIFLYLSIIGTSTSCLAQDQTIFEEKDGMVAVEAEHFQRQTLTDVRQWHIVASDQRINIAPDGDEAHTANASGEKYVEILPDTRRTHDDELIHGENFSNEPGQLGILDYPIYFNTPGRYYVWVRAYSTGTEDNGIHVGINGEWVESGQRMQWCEGKQSWAWASKQRTKEVHCGVEKLIFLDIPSQGVHTIQFSMREDGFEFDKFVLTQVYESPEGMGPAEKKKPRND